MTKTKLILFLKLKDLHQLSHNYYPGCQRLVHEYSPLSPSPPASLAWSGFSCRGQGAPLAGCPPQRAHPSGLSLPCPSSRPGLFTTQLFDGIAFSLLQTFLFKNSSPSPLCVCSSISGNVFYPFSISHSAPEPLNWNSKYCLKSIQVLLVKWLLRKWKSIHFGWKKTRAHTVERGAPLSVFDDPLRNS